MKPANEGAAQAALSPQGIVVPHTHWDREWYLTSEGYRARLVAMIDGLLDVLERDPAFSHFLLDAQTIMIDDYLEVRPEAAARLRAMIAAGRIMTGPWYTSADTFLPDPEALVRNLQIGMAESRMYGHEPLRVGYMPDIFGFPAQMPQLLQHFDLPYAFVWRGTYPPNGGSGFWWEAPDGSRVLAMRPPGGYYESGWGVFNPDHYVDERLPGIMERQRADAYPHRLMVVGMDHCPANPRLPWLVERIAARVGHSVRMGSLEEMGALIEQHGDAIPTVRGEMRDPSLAIIPLSSNGTRIPLKQANQEIEALLLGVAEPLQALAELAGAGSDRAHLRWAWKILCQNHPHDSIAGTSSDAVHREMETRFERARTAALDVIDRGATRLARALDPAARGTLGAIGVVGLSGGVARLRVRLHGPESGIPDFRIVDTDGSEVRYRGLGSGAELVQYDVWEDAFYRAWKIGYLHLVAPAEWLQQPRYHLRSFSLPYVDIEIQLATPRAGYRVLKLEPGRAASVEAATELKNEFVSVRLGAEGLFLTDQRSGRTVGPIRFAHGGDGGDAYTTMPVGEPVIFAADAERAEFTADALGGTVRAPINVTVPAGLDESRKARVGSAMLDGAIEVRLVGRRVEIDLALENRARDFDLRLVAPVAGAESVHCGAPYGSEQRRFELGHPLPEDAPQQWLPEFPFRGWVGAVDDEGAGMALLARGLYEAAGRQVSDGVELEITLLRGTGQLSRDDLPTRVSGHIGPDWPTPDAQGIGPQRWQLGALLFGAGEADRAPAWSEQFLRPPAAFPVQRMAGTAPAAQEYFAGAEQLVVSTLKPTQEGNGAMLHAFNPTDQSLAATVEGRRARLDEAASDGGAEVGPHKIVAWKLAAP